jgi:hypothetical protein
MAIRETELMAMNDKMNRHLWLGACRGKIPTSISSCQVSSYKILLYTVFSYFEWTFAIDNVPIFLQWSLEKRSYWCCVLLNLLYEADVTQVIFWSSLKHVWWVYIRKFVIFCHYYVVTVDFKCESRRIQGSNWWTPKKPLYHSSVASKPSCR